MAPSEPAAPDPPGSPPSGGPVTARAAGALRGWSLVLRAGEASALLTAGLVLFAIGGFFIWPHVFGVLTAEEVLDGIPSAPAAFLMRLDPVVLIASLTQLPLFLALWVALRSTHPSGATLAALSGGVGVIAMLPTRPLVEVYALAARFAEASGEAERTALLATAELLLAQFHGTSWAIGIVLGGLAGVGFGAVMRISPRFGSVTAWTGILAGAGSLAFLLPVVGVLLLFVLGTVGSVVWLVLVARDLRRVRATLH